MVLKRNPRWLLILLFFCVGKMFSAINFGDRRSAIKILDGAKLNVLSSGGNMAVTDGSVVKKYSGEIVGNDIDFTDGILESDGAESLLTAVYDPADGYDNINLTGDHYIKAEPGRVYQTVSVSGDNNTIEGQPRFWENITLADANTTLTFGLQNKLNKNVVMNDGRLFLVDDLRLCDDVQLTGQGRVILNDRQFQFGGKDLDWAGRIYWDHATDLVMNSKISLSTTWSFGGTSYLNGNGNILDLSQGGTLWVRSGATLNLTDVKIKGLGSGWFVFEDQTSQIRLSNVDIEMDRTYSVTNGGIYVEGPTTIVTKDKLLIFDLLGSMTVDGETLWYDTLSYNDSENIRPEVPFDTDDVATGGESSHITLQNGGIIRLAAGEGAGEEIGDIYYNDAETKVFTTNMFLSTDRKLYVTDDVTIDGNNHYIQFSRDTSSLIEVSSGKTLKFRDVVLKDFSPDHLGGAGSVEFEDGTIIEMAKNDSLSANWLFRGHCILNGQGHILDVNSNQIQLNSSTLTTNGGALLFEDVTLQGIEDSSGTPLVRCLAGSSTFSFADVIWMQSGNYTFNTGHLAILGMLDMKNSYTFAYKTNRQSSIESDGSLIFDTGFTFSYAPSIANRDLISMADATSQLILNGCTLGSTSTGLQLSNGTLIIDHKNYLYNQDEDGTRGVAISEAIAFGDGANDLNIEVMPGGNVELVTGHLVYQNAN
jgi:hypothetical protein